MGMYDDLINYNYTGIKTHKKMSIAARAGQFAPFSALVGYEDAIKETGRITDKKIEKGEDLNNLLDEKINYLINNKDRKVTFKYFIKDNKKSGGVYKEQCGFIKKIDLINRVIIFKDSSIIEIDNIIDIKY